MQMHMLTKVRYIELFSGVAFHNLGKFDDAIKMYDQALKINPNNEGTYNSKGKIYRVIFRSCNSQFTKI